MPFRFQFSLRTLALAAILIGSAGLLWRNWGPWRVHVLNHAGRIHAASFSADNAWLATCSDAGECFIWELPSERKSRALPHSARIDSLEWSPDSRLLATKDGVGALRIWDARNWQCRHVLAANGHLSRGFSPDGTRLLSFDHKGSDDAMHLWDTDSGKCLAEFGDQHHFQCYSDDSQFLLMNIWWPNFKGKELTPAQQEDEGLELWNARTGKRLWKVKLQSLRILELKFVPGGERIFCHSEEHHGEIITSLYTVRFAREFDTQSGALISERETFREDGWGSHSIKFALGWKDAFSRDGKRRIFLREHALCLEECESHRQLAVLPGFQVTASSAKAALSENGEHIVAGNYLFENDAYLWTRRRPEDWWGIFCLLELWVVIAMSGVVLWSVVIDRSLRDRMHV